MPPQTPNHDDHTPRDPLAGVSAPDQSRRTVRLRLQAIACSRHNLSKTRPERATLPAPEGRSRDHVAKLSGASARTVQDAATVKDHDPRPGLLPAVPACSANAVPRLALSVTEAAAAIGVSRDYFDEHVMPELRIVRRGRRKLIAVRELERWLEAAAARTLETRAHR